MPKIVTAWQCSYCNMTSVYKSSVTRHEKRDCSKNKACGICKHFDASLETVYDPYHGGDPGSTDYDVLVLGCDKPEIVLEKKRTNCPHFEEN